MAYNLDGKALFSTRNGEYARRDRIPTMRTILRSHPIEDQQIMAARLQEEFPEVCKKITIPVTNTDVYEYFDYCDAAVHGFEFLRAVLEYIAQLNANVNAERASKIQDYVSRWKNANLEAFTHLRPYHALTDLFTKEDIEVHEVEFLTDAMIQIKHMRIQEDGNETRQSAICLQAKHAHMTHNQHIYTQFPDPSRPQFAADLSSAQGMRASSNPKRGQPQPQGGPLRHLPGIQCQLAAPQDRFPLQKLTPSTEILEHVCPGSTSRGDFHSDPTAYNAMNNNNSGPLNASVAIPPRGLPGPFNYRPLPPSTQPIPLLNRTGTFDWKLPKGKKNPRKNSSDDARILPSPGNSPHLALRSASHQRAFTPEDAQISFHPRSFDTMSSAQEERSSSGAVHISDDYHHPRMPPCHHSTSLQEHCHCSNYYKQIPMHPTTEPHSHEYAGSNPFSPSATKLHGSIYDPRTTELGLPMPTKVQHQDTTANQQLFEGNADLAATQVPPHSSQPLYPHVFGRQLPGHESDVQHQQDHSPNFERSALATMSNSSQAQRLGTLGQSIAKETPRRPVRDGCTIWIGGLPNGFDKVAVMDLLRPCRGLLDTSNPRISSPSRYRACRSYVFANFQNPDDAAEALERLPQMRFASLPDGSFLGAEYPRYRDFASPGHKQHESYGGSKRAVFHLSSIKSRKGEDSTHAEKSKNEHGRKPSKGLARGKESSNSTLEGRSRELSERIGVVEADQKESEVQPEKATVSPGPNAKVGPTAYVNHSSTNGSDSMPMNWDPGLIQPNVGVESHAIQAPEATGDGPQETSSSPGAKFEDQESHQATSSGQTKSHTKASKKKKRGSNKLPVPETKGSRTLSATAPMYPNNPDPDPATTITLTTGDVVNATDQSLWTINGVHTDYNAPVPLLANAGITFYPYAPEWNDLNTGNATSVGSVVGNITPMAHTALERAKSEAQEKTFIEQTCKIPDGSTHLEKKGNQSTLEIEASEVTAATVPLEPTSTISKCLETTDQSFLGCNPMDNGGEQPASSNGNVVKASGARDNKMEVSETALTPMGSILSAVSVEQSKEPVSQAMRRDVSSSTQGSTTTDLSILNCTGPSSNFQTECSSSITQDTLSPVIQAAHPSSEVALLPPFLELGKLKDNVEAIASQSRTAMISNSACEEAEKSREATPARLEGETSRPIAEPGEIIIEQISISANVAPSETGKASLEVQEEVQNSIKGELEGLQLGLIEENPLQIRNVLSIHPSPSKSEGITSKSPTRERALSIPPRLSSLAAPSTPIKTYQQKKPRNLTPVTEASYSNVTDLSIEGTKRDSSPQTTESTKLKFPVWTIDLAGPADQSRDLPKPETPFLMDNGVRVPPPKINPQIVGPSNADQYYAQKTYDQVFRRGNAKQINATFCSSKSSGSTSTHVSKASTSGHTDLETTLREAGFRSLATSNPFTIKTPELAWLETIDGVAGPMERRNNKDEPMLILDKGNVGPFMIWDAWTKHQEMIEVVEKATAVKRIMTESPRLPWTKIVSLRKRLSRFVTHGFSNAHEQQTTKSTAQQTLKAKTLLNAIPQRDSSISEMRNWSRRVSLFMDENASKPSCAFAGSRKSTTNKPGGSFGDTPSKRRQPECQHTVPINQPGPQALARRHSKNEDAFPTANTELNYSPTIGLTTGSEPSPSTCGRRTQCEDQSTLSLVLTPFAALNQSAKLKDLFVEMGAGRRRWSDDCHRFSTPQEEERIIISDPELLSIGGELDEIKVEQGFKELEALDKAQGNKGHALGCAKGRDQEAIVKCDKIEELTPTRPENETPQKLKGLAHQKHSSQLNGLSFQSSGSNHTSIAESVTDEAQRIPPRGEQSLLMRSSYNAVASRGVDGRRSGKHEASKDPWALPQGEKPWGSGSEGTGGKKKRER